MPFARRRVHTLVARAREVAPTDRADPASSPARRAGWGEEPPRRWPRQRLVVILSLGERLEVDGRIMRGVCPSRRNVRLTKGALKQASSPPMLGGSLASSASSAKRLNFLRRTTLPRGLKPTIRRHPCRCRCRELRVFFGPGAHDACLLSNVTALTLQAGTGLLKQLVLAPFFSPMVPNTCRQPPQTSLLAFLPDQTHSRRSPVASRKSVRPGRQLVTQSCRRHAAPIGPQTGLS